MMLGLSVLIYIVFLGYGGDQTLSQSRTKAIQNCPPFPKNQKIPNLLN
jgi:hypothetical protein